MIPTISSSRYYMAGGPPNRYHAEVYVSPKPDVCKESGPTISASF